MWARTLAITATLAFLPASALGQELAAPPVFYPNGSLAGTGLWDCYLCDVTGVRNIQGGKREDPNLDIGAGSSTDRGNVVLNFDVGRCVHIFDGRERRVASFCPRRIVFYRPVVYRRR